MLSSRVANLAMQTLIVCFSELVAMFARSLVVRLASVVPAPRLSAHEASLIWTLGGQMGKTTTWGLVLEQLSPSSKRNDWDRLEMP